MPLILEDLPFGIAERLVGTLTDRRHFWTPLPDPVGCTIGADVRPGDPCERHASDLARPPVDEHELVPRRRPANARVR